MRKLSSINEQKFPNPNGGEDVRWNGEKFVGKQIVASDVLVYPMSNSRMGWDDDLTTFREEISNGEHPIDKASFDLAIRNLKKYYFSLPNRGGVGQILEIGCSSCMVPYCGGCREMVPLSKEEKELLWARYYTAAPRRQRQCVEQYKIVKRV
jgi:hypothetical protein